MTKTTKLNITNETPHNLTDINVSFQIVAYAFASKLFISLPLNL